ncbi:MAG: hypothetical protein QOD63_932 [Actinomycetota bacterium]|nr:hypothetical protein [Actinomycetota bacterium]
MGLSDQLKSSSARTPALVLGILLVVAVGLAVVVARQGNGPDTVTVIRASPPDPSTTSSTTPGAVADPSATTTSVPGAAVPTVTRPSAVGNPGPTAPPPGPDPVVTTAVPPPPPPSGETPQCTPGQADQTLATDKAPPTYAAGEPVTVTATVRNHSATSCAVANPDSNCYLLFMALASNGAESWRSGPAPTGPCSPLPRRTLFPGAVVSYTATWDQSNRGGPRVPGLYTIQSRWLAESKSALLELLP